MDQRKKEVIKHFDAWSVSYEQEVWTRDRFFHKLIKKTILNLILKLKAHKILELGVGTGIYLKNFLQKDQFIVAMDISNEMLKKTKANLRQDYNLLNFILADAEFFPFRNGTFDIINCIEVLRHLPYPNKTIWNVFKEMRRTLLKQGFILITMPNILFPLNLFWIFYYLIPRNIMRILHKGIGFHYNSRVSFPHFPVLYNEPEDHMFNLFFIKKLCNKLNLKISQLNGIFFFPACPKILFPIIRRIDLTLGKSFWAFLAYSFIIQLKY